MTDIRPLKAQDEGDWRRLWADYLAFYETTRPDSVFRATFTRLLDAAEPMRGLVAVADGRVVGLAHLIFHRHCWSEGDTCYLQDLYVDQDMRGEGLGRKLIEACYAEADAAGAVTVYWMTQEFNYAARMLYDRVGVRTPFIKYQRP
ncbi:GNAT family N-acetyltransferase [Rubrimonas cliftonensis]|uniref:Acetyltransferase (GNAT) family protein n=1 Tax=Rubrimonas cliftonensis TaxID=89524 RepID=A0A1H3YV10_9RHOB|nr:GNAT family N-acetyltransferase [Rubrimonas cliftonensis]SEA15041.1 Acetyltransferase (GNAT) family protein [Rubrimonas cliftonensis]